MDAQELFLRDGKSAGVWYCGKCRHVHKAQYEAEQCCQPRMCRCGKELEHVYAVVCKYCLRDAHRRKDLQRLDDAELVKYEGGYVFDVGGGGSHDGFFSDMEELIDWYANEHEGDTPEFVHACTSRVLRPSSDIILNYIYDNGYEDICEQIVGIEDMDAALDRFIAANEQTLTIWKIDFKRKYLVSDE